MSTTRTSTVRKLTRVGVCLELLLDTEVPAKFVQLVTSLPSRPGTLTKTWTLQPFGIIDDTVWQDMVNYVDGVLLDAITLAGGVQDRLPGL